jgi:hypothetical protein
MLKLYKVYRNLSEVVICDDDGKMKLYAHEETLCDDRFEERKIKQKIETDFNIKFLQSKEDIEEEERDNNPLNNLPRI